MVKIDDILTQENSVIISDLIGNSRKIIKSKYFSDLDKFFSIIESRLYAATALPDDSPDKDYLSTIYSTALRWKGDDPLERLAYHAYIIRPFKTKGPQQLYDIGQMVKESDKQIYLSSDKKYRKTG